MTDFFLLFSSNKYLFWLVSSNGATNGTASGSSAAVDGASAAAALAATTDGLDELTKKQALAEEEAMYEKLRVSRLFNIYRSSTKFCRLPFEEFAVDSSSFPCFF